MVSAAKVTIPATSTQAWKTAPMQEQELFRTPKRMRRGIAGDELGPAFML